MLFYKSVTWRQSQLCQNGPGKSFLPSGPRFPQPHEEGVRAHRGRQTFSIKGQRVDVPGFAGHEVSVTVTQLCHGGMKAALGGV